MAFTQNAINNLLATTSLTGTIATSQIAASAVTYAKIQQTSAGSVLLGNPTGSAAAPSEITLGTGLSFAGTVLNATGSFAPIPQTVVSGTTQAMAANNGYIANNAALCTLTLPSTASVGQLLQVTGQGVGGWKVAQNAGQTIIFNSNTTTSGTGGSLASTLQTDMVYLMCTVANTTFNVIGSQGNIAGI